MAERGIQVIDRAFDILEILSVEKDGLGVTGISNRIGLHKSTVHRILNSMVSRGYIEKLPDRGTYKIGLKLIEISSIYLNSIELKTEARPYLGELTSRLGLPVHLATLDGIEAVYIDKVDVLNNIRLYSQIGRRVPVHCSALGKCLISGLDGQELEELAGRIKFTRFTNNTITDKKTLLEQVRLVGTQGWALDNEEHEAGMKCIAAPVRDYRGTIIAAISVTGPSGTVSPERENEIGGIVVEASRKISRRMGFKC